MGSLKTYKTVTILLLLVSIVLIIVAFAGIKNSLAGGEQLSHAYKWSMFALILIILMDIVFVYIIFTLSSDKIYNTQLKKIREQQAAQEKEQKLEAESNKKEKDNVEIEEDELAAINWKQVEKQLLPDARSATNAEKLTEKYLSNLAKMFEVVQGVLFTQKTGTDEYTLTGKFAYIKKDNPNDFKAGETIPGQVVKNRKPLVVDKIPDNYVTVLSGLGESSPRYLMLVPFIKGDNVLGVMELAMFKKPDTITQEIVNKVSEKFSEQLSKILA